MFLSAYRKVRPDLSAKGHIFGRHLARVATIIIGIVILAEFAATHVSGEYGPRTPTDDRFTQFDTWPADGFENGGAFGFDFGKGFKAEIEGLGFHADAIGSSNLPLPGSLSANHLKLVGMYEFSDGAWRVTPYIGGDVGAVNVSERLLGGAYDQATAYQLRGGVTLGLTQTLLGNLEYRWTNGSKPYLSFAGVPARLEVDNHRVRAGVNYRF